ncbi:MAG: hypothetical protein WC373_11095 [Smithella sp.]|jgi:hypothetical protein
MPYWLFLFGGFSLTIGFGVSLYKKNWYFMFMSIPIFVLSIVITTILLYGTGDNPQYSQRYTEDTPIYSLRTNELVDGSFVLGSGSINSETYYIYYTQEADGAYSINQLKASECKIYLDRDTCGVLTKVWKKCDDENLVTHWGWSETIFNRYEFHLPYGSLIQDYSVK